MKNNGLWGMMILVGVWGCSAAAPSGSDNATRGARPTTPNGSTAATGGSAAVVTAGTSHAYAGSGNIGASQSQPFNGTGGTATATGGSSAGGATSGPFGGLSATAGSAAVGVTPPPATTTGDQFAAVGTNPFIVTAHDPLSTFGADVDTASYDIFRSDVGLGFLPAADSVRLEEYVNAFSYDYPSPAQDSTTPFSISLAAGPSLFQRDTVMLRVGIQGKIVPPGEKKPANLVFLIDTSGSMAASNKLPLVKEVLSHGLEVLDPTDTVSIVTYSETARVELDPTPVAQASVISQVLATLNAGGSTAGAPGIQTAYNEAQAGFIEGGINHIIMCTDGDFNVGISDTASLVAFIKQKKTTGITLTTLGFGTGDLNDAMMEQVSDAGDGVYSVITDVADADKYAEESLLSNIVYIAKDMKLQVEFNPELVYAYRLLGYEDRAVADQQFRNDAVDGGEVGAGHRVTALYELALTNDLPAVDGAPAPLDGAPYADPLEVAANDLVLVKVRYKELTAATTDPALEVNQSLAATAVSSHLADLDADFQWAESVAAFAEILKHSPYADLNALPAIGEALANPANDTHPDRVEFRQLFNSASPLLATP